MDYISQSPLHCSKGNLKGVLKCNKFRKKKEMVTCSIKTLHQLNTDTKHLVLVLP